MNLRIRQAITHTNRLRYGLVYARRALEHRLLLEEKHDDAG